MVLNRSLADAQMRGDVLAGMAGKHEAQNLPLTRRQTIEMGGGVTYAALALGRSEEDVSSARLMLATSSSWPNGFSMKSEAPACMALTANDTSPCPVIMIEGRAI